MKGTSKILALFLSAVMAVGVCTACTDPQEPDGPQQNQNQQDPGETTRDEVRFVTLKQGGYIVGETLEAGLADGTLTFTAEVIKDDGADGKVTWTSDNEAVAAVSEGTVTLKTAGEATIRAEAGSKSASVKLSVKDGTVEAPSRTPEVAFVTIMHGGKVVENTVTVYLEDESAKLDAIVTMDDGADDTVTWTSGDNDIAMVSSQGTLKLKDMGEVTIKAQAGDKSAEVRVNVARKYAAPETNDAAIYSVAIQYNNASVSTISADLSTETLSLKAAVSAEKGADYLLEWSSSDNAVATVEGDNDGAEVTLTGSGETVIKAVATDRAAAQVVLTVKDDAAVKKYTITITDGKALNAEGQEVTSAAAGEQIIIEPTIPAHKNFERWEIENEKLVLNGNSFRMPEENVIASAEFSDIYYPLTIVGGRVTKAGAQENPQGEAGGGDTDQTKEMTYRFIYGTQITIKAAEAKSGMTFVGWDYQAKNNRAGEVGVDEYTFEMGDADTSTYTSVYSNFDKEVWQPVRVSDSVYAATCTSYPSVNFGCDSGKPEMEGLAGLTLTIPATASRLSGAPENIHNPPWTFKTYGRAMGKLILKNNSDTYSVKLEFFGSFLGILAASGVIEVGPQEVVTKNFVLSYGLPQNIYWGVAVREDIGGKAGDSIVIDAGFGVAETLYPDGDPFNIPSTAEKVELGTDSGGVTRIIKGESWGSAGFYPGSGNASVMTWQNNFGTNDEGRWAGTPIMNMPEDDGSGKTVIYGRLINLASSMLTDTTPAGYKFVIATGNSPTEGVVASYDGYVENVGDVVLFKLEIPRTDEAEDVVYNFFIIKETIEAEAVTYQYGFAVNVNLTYNNIFGYQEAK